jgi:hypothetical protein
MHVDGYLVYYHLDDEFYRAQAAKRDAAEHGEEDGEKSPQLGGENALTFPGDDVAERNHFIYQCHGTYVPYGIARLRWQLNLSLDQAWLRTSTPRTAACLASTVITSRTLSRSIYSADTHDG